MAKNVEYDFLGRGWSFPIRIDPRTRGVQMVTGEEDIRESLRILINTRPGERVMQPTFGCAIWNTVFEIMSQQTVTQIQEMIRRAVLFFEPRIDLENIIVTVDDASSGRLLIELGYSVRSTNSRSNCVFPFYLNQGTGTFGG
jgi:uncharacterized protein